MTHKKISVVEFFLSMMCVETKETGVSRFQSFCSETEIIPLKEKEREREREREREMKKRRKVRKIINVSNLIIEDEEKVNMILKMYRRGSKDVRRRFFVSYVFFYWISHSHLLQYSQHSSNA